MKPSNFNLMVTLFIIGLLAALNVGCSTSTEPQVIVVTATPTSTTEAATTPVPTPTLAPSATATPQSAVPPTPTPPPVYPAGTLLKGSGDGVFYLNQAGARQHIYDWDTFLAFGFTENNIVAVDDEIMAAIPLAGELTRLLLDDQGDLYWVAAEQRWLVNEWRHIVTQPDYPLPITQADAALSISLPKYVSFANGLLLRDKTQLYYFDHTADIQPSLAGMYARIIPVAADDVQSKVIDVPSGILAAYQLQAQVERVNINLAAQTPAANLRAQPTLTGQVLTIVQSTDPITAYGWTTTRDWLLVNAQGQYGWLAGDVVEPALALSLLSTGVRRETFTNEIPQPTPAVVVEKSSTSTPVLCYDTPMRGFGKVWGDHAEVQAGLSCPGGGEQGTAAAAQPFEHGLMLWLQADTSYSADPVYVLFDDGSYQRFGDLGPADPAKIGEFPAGFAPVGDKFSKVYWEGTGARVKERLGYATGPAANTAGAYQQFYNGRMFWAESLKRIFVIYDYYRYDSQGNSTQIRAWAGYEDKF